MILDCEKRNNWKKDENENKRTMKGITLIALVITIIVLLILVGVSIAMLTGENGILNQANKAKQETEKAKNEELGLLGDYENLLENYTQSEEGYNETNKVNSPKLTSGMIAVRYDEGSKNWVKADESNKDNNWYEYSEVNKKWANVVTVKENGSKSRKEYTNAPEGTVIPMEDITTMFVWIPRYSYEILGEKNIGVSFLKGNTNKESNGSETTKIVHPGFKFGDVNLKGIWVAKFEASGVNEDGGQVGNASSTSGTVQNAVTENTVLEIKPSVTSWRYITIGESQYRSMKMAADIKNYGWNNVNSHLIKNAEWGAVAYLSYSTYGNVPKINTCASYANNSTGSYYYDFMTGAGPLNESSESRYNYDSSTFDLNQAYNTTNGKLASTTHNEYGIYDMNGGAWERVAAYLDNTNSNLNTYGKSTTNSSIKYFENGELNSSYTNYWEKYQVSEEEKSNKIQIEDGEILTQSQLWNINKIEKKYQEARLRLTKEIFDNLKNNKGIGINEEGLPNKFSYYAPYEATNGTKVWSWFTTAEQPINKIIDVAKTWDDDCILIGHVDFPFVLRGGGCSSVSSAGVLNSDINNGFNYNNISFRPVLAF